MCSGPHKRTTLTTGGKRDRQKPNRKPRFFLQNLPKPTDSKIFETVTTLVDSHFPPKTCPYFLSLFHHSTVIVSVRGFSLSSVDKDSVKLTPHIHVFSYQLVEVYNTENWNNKQETFDCPSWIDALAHTPNPVFHAASRLYVLPTIFFS